MTTVIILSVSYLVYIAAFFGVSMYFDRKYQKRIDKRIKELEEEISKIRNYTDNKFKDYGYLSDRLKQLNDNIAYTNGDLRDLEIKVEKHIYEEDNAKNADKIKAEIKDLITTCQPVSYELLQSYNFVVGNQQSEENQE